MFIPPPPETCHMSRVTCHVSQSLIFIYFSNFNKWWSLLVKCLLSTGPTPSIFFLLLLSAFSAFCNFLWHNHAHCSNNYIAICVFFYIFFLFHFFSLHVSFTVLFMTLQNPLLKKLHLVLFTSQDGFTFKISYSFRVFRNSWQSLFHSFP